MPLQVLTDEVLERPLKVGITGESGSGKTHKLIESMVWARSRVKTADELLIAFIDCDDGIRPLISRGLLPKDIKPRIRYGLYTKDWNGIRDDSKETVGILKDWAKDHGPHSAYMYLDNAGKVWDWLHDDFCIDVFGTDRAGMMRQARKKAIENDKKAMPVLNQMLDYGVLNHEFYKWWDPIQFSAINFILTCPAWLTRVDDQANGGKKIVDVNMKGVQPELVHRLDELFWTHTPENNGPNDTVRVSSLIKRRNCSKSFRNVADLSFTNWMKWVEKYRLDKPLEMPV